MKWNNRERKLKNRRRYRLQDKIHREKGQGKDKQSKKRMAIILREQRKLQPLPDDDTY